MKEISLFCPYVPKKDILKNLDETLSTKWIGQGPKVKEFEEQFNKTMNYKYSVMTNSGTSALELSYHLIGLTQGDEVIAPILNCTAGLMALKRLGVNIIFADIDENLTIDPIDIERKITAKTKAIMGVHLGGIEFSKEVNHIANKYNLSLITDSAQHHKHCTGDYICYSFQAIKHITTGDGGMLILNNEKEYNRAKLLRWFGIDRDKKEKNNFQAWKHRQMTFDIEEAGFKFQPTDIDACFGLAALPHLSDIIEKRKSLSLLYNKLLPLDKCIPIYGGSYWLFGILTDQRDELAQFLMTKKIETNLIHLRNDIFSIFGGKRQDLKYMNNIESKYLYLPLHTNINEADVEYICNTIREFYE